MLLCQVATPSVDVLFLKAFEKLGDALKVWSLFHLPKGNKEHSVFCNVQFLSCLFFSVDLCTQVGLVVGTQWGEVISNGAFLLSCTYDFKRNQVVEIKNETTDNVMIQQFTDLWI